MKQFVSAHDVVDAQELIKKAIDAKNNKEKAWNNSARGKTLGLVFFNPSLRTRLSTQKAANMLGFSVMVMNVNSEGWTLEFNNDAVMDGDKVEHIKEAAGVMGRYCDIIGLRSFPTLKSKEEDYAEEVFQAFKQYASVPIISLESATLHPLQSLADVMTIVEQKNQAKPNIVLAWAPHIKPLPQAVANSFAQWVEKMQWPLTIACPPAYELSTEFAPSAAITHHLDEALATADFIYVKNWSSYHQYGEMPPVEGNWLLTEDRLKNNPAAKIMHCLPVRRNVELGADLLDGPRSLVLEQANNRVYAAYVVLKELIVNS